MTPQIRLDSEQIAGFCRKHRLRKLSLFGSVLREDFGPESDVDVLIEFEEGAPMSLLRIAAMEIELTEMIGRQVDLRLPEELSRYFRDEVLAEAVVQYAA